MFNADPPSSSLWISDISFAERDLFSILATAAPARSVKTILYQPAGDDHGNASAFVNFDRPASAIVAAINLRNISSHQVRSSHVDLVLVVTAFISQGASSPLHMGFGSLVDVDSTQFVAVRSGCVLGLCLFDCA